MDSEVDTFISKQLEAAWAISSPSATSGLAQTFSWIRENELLRMTRFTFAKIEKSKGLYL